MHLCECGCGSPTRFALRTDSRYGHVKGQPTRFKPGHNWRGAKHSDETRQKLSGSNNGQWREDAKYTAKHMWAYKHIARTGTCQKCGREPEPYKGMKVGTDFANLSGEYKRDIEDWVELCRSCHGKVDKPRSHRRKEAV